MIPKLMNMFNKVRHRRIRQNERLDVIIHELGEFHFLCHVLRCAEGYTATTTDVTMYAAICCYIATVETEFDCKGLHRRHLRRHHVPSAAIELESFENSYIPENPRTPKPLTFSKNRLQEA
ncbi:hypothetical protein LXL04_017226 [Taraxacum kok-saghyz]